METIGSDTVNSRGTAITIGTFNSKGSYADLGDATADFSAIVLGFEGLASAFAAIQMIYDVRVGGDTVVLADGYSPMVVTFGVGSSILIPVGGKSGDSIEVRIATDYSSTYSAYANVQLLTASEWPFVSSPNYETIGIVSASSRGTLVPPDDSSANTLGDWTYIGQLSNPYDYVIVMAGSVYDTSSSDTWLVDIGVEDGTDETVLIPEIQYGRSSYADAVAPNIKSFFVDRADFQKDAKIVARAQCSTTSATQRDIYIALACYQLSTPGLYMPRRRIVR